MGGDVTMESTPGRGHDDAPRRCRCRSAIRRDVEPRSSRPPRGRVGEPAAAKPSRARPSARAACCCSPRTTRSTAPCSRSSSDIDRLPRRHRRRRRGGASSCFVAGRYGLVLTDLNMPRMDGFELARGDPPPRARDGRRADADHRADRERHAGRAGALPRRRDGRLRRQADDDPVPRGEAAPVAAASRLGARRRATSTRGELATEGAAIDPSVLDLLTGGDAGPRAAVLDDFLATQPRRHAERCVRRSPPSRRREQPPPGAPHQGRGADRRRARDVALVAADRGRGSRRGRPDWPAIAALADRLRDALARTEASVMA